jgi:Zn-dependent M28 family amino/carboxypeptidase
VYIPDVTDFSAANGKIALISSAVAPMAMLDVAYAAEDGGVLGLVVYSSASQGGIYGTRLRTVAYLEGDRLVEMPVIGTTHAMGMVIRELLTRGLQTVRYWYFTEFALAVLTFLTELVLTVLVFLAEVFLSLSHCVLTFLTELAFAVQMELVANNDVRIVETYNVIAETRGGDANSVVMCGAHLDSVAGAAGINDDGSGSAAILAIAQTLDADITAGTVNLVNKARFGWWGSEEIGLLGSRHYVNELIASRRTGSIASYSNYDMIAGPNYYLGIHQGADAATVNARTASTALQKLYEEQMDGMNERYELARMTGGSDFLPFLDASIPTGGLLTGAGGRKTTDQVPIFGGFANTQFDPCYHADCDNIDNISIEALRSNTFAAGNVLLELVETPDLKSVLLGLTNMLGWTTEEAGTKSFEVLQAFDDIANANSGSRSIVNGYDDSARYIIDTLEQYPDVWTVTEQEFTTLVDNWTGYTQVEDARRPSVTFPGTLLDFKVCDPVTGFQRYDQSCDYAAVRYGGSGSWDLTREVVFVDPPVEDQYTQADFENAAGKFALISNLGNIRDAAYAAEDAGVEALFVIGTPPADDPFGNPLTNQGGPYGSNLYYSPPLNDADKEREVVVPVIGMSFAMGTVVKDLLPLEAAFTGENNIRRVTTTNVIVESIDGNAENVVFAGAHLDGVAAGAGINDDGSGSAAILAIAEQMALRVQSGDLTLENKVRFGWWGAEETGIFGSEFYAQSLEDAGTLGNILSYSNFDMLASPNYILQIHRGSDAPEDAQPVAIALQEMFQERMEALGFMEGSGYRLVPMTGGSDFVPFRARDVATGGLNTGAGGVKSAEEAAMYGGMANVQADPCYHADCDNINNVARPALDVNTYVAGDVFADLASMPDVRVTLAARPRREDTNPATASIPARNLRALEWEREEAGDLAFEVLKAFDVIARGNDGSRSVENGYDASGQYIMDRLDQLPNIEYEIQTFRVAVDDWSGVAPGKDPKVPTLSFPFAAPEILFKKCEANSGQQKYQVSCDYAGVRYGGNGTYDLTREVVYIADVADFSAAANKIALISSAVAPMVMLDVAYAAEAADVAGLVIYNSASQGGVYGVRLRTVAYLEGDQLVQIPVIGTTHAMGMVIRELVEIKVELKMQLVANNEVRIVETYNVIASTVGGDENSVVMCGAHLDGVAYGAGINDDGSGSAAILAIAQTLDAGITAGTVNLVNKARFGWWGSEEIGLLGSRHYVNGLLASGTTDTIALYSNYDMLAGPNYYLGIHQGSDAKDAAQTASTTLQKLYEEQMVALGLNYELSGMTGGSDFLPFLDESIPTGGLLTGAGGRKGTDEVPTFGGLANAQYDPCYHADCDNIDNIAIEALRTNTFVAGNVLVGLVETPNLKNVLAPPSSDDGLSGGAIAGITIGVLGAAALAAGAYSYSTKSAPAASGSGSGLLSAEKYQQM